MMSIPIDCIDRNREITELVTVFRPVGSKLKVGRPCQDYLCVNQMSAQAIQLPREFIFVYRTK